MPAPDPTSRRAERREPSERRGPRGHRPLLGVVAYVLVPGERRVRAVGHFRRAGFEALLGARALVRPGRPATGGTATGAPQEAEEASGRQRIEIE